MKTRLAFGVLWLASARADHSGRGGIRRDDPPATCRGAPRLGDGRCECRRAVRRLRVRGGARACRSEQERGHLCARPVNRSRDAGKRRHQWHRWRWDGSSSTEWGRPVPWYSRHARTTSQISRWQPAVPQVLLRDRRAGTTTLVSRTLTGTPANGVSGHADISDDGGTVVFQSAATDLVDEEDRNGPRVRRLRVRCSFAQNRACERGRERGAAGSRIELRANREWRRSERGVRVLRTTGWRVQPATLGSGGRRCASRLPPQSQQRLHSTHQPCTGGRRCRRLELSASRERRRPAGGVRFTGHEPGAARQEPCCRRLSARRPHPTDHARQPKRQGEAAPPARATIRRSRPTAGSWPSSRMPRISRARAGVRTACSISTWSRTSMSSTR